jgi:hypothetical protein
VKSAGIRNLPTRFARLSRGFPVVFVREPIPSAAALAAASTIATAVPTAAAFPAATARTTLAAPAVPSESAGTCSARWSAFAFRPRFIYFQVAATGFFAIQTRDGLRSFGIVGHFHESKSACSPRFAVHGHVHTRHLTKGLEQGSQIALCRLKVHVSHKKTFHVASPGF